MRGDFDPVDTLRRADPASGAQIRTGARTSRSTFLLETILSGATQLRRSRNLRGVSWEGRDDAELLNAAQRDREAFGVFYRQHALAVYRWFAYRVEREGALAAELTAETFAEALRSLPRFEGTEPGTGTSWLFGIARNLAREHHRRRRVRDDARRELGIASSGIPDHALDEADDRVDSERLRERLEAALAELPPAQRRAVTLRVVSELDYATIARAESSTEQSVRLRVSRGLRALRAQLAPVMNEEET